MTLRDAAENALVVFAVLAVVLVVGAFIYASWPAVLILIGLGVLILLAFGALTLLIWATGNLYARLWG